MGTADIDDGHRTACLEHPGRPHPPLSRGPFPWMIRNSANLNFRKKTDWVGPRQCGCVKVLIPQLPIAATWIT
jgi:hypothetical protein